MYSGPTRRQMYGLPMYPQNAETSYSGQSSLQNYQFDGLPRVTPDQFMTSSLSAVRQYTLPSQMGVPQTPMSWSDPQAFDDVNTSDFYGHYSPSIGDSPHGSAILRSNNDMDIEIPRFTPNQPNIRFFGDNGNNSGSMMDTYASQPSLYISEASSKHGDSSKSHSHHPQPQLTSYLDSINSSSNSLPHDRERERFSRLSVSQSPILKTEFQDSGLPHALSFAPGPLFRLPSTDDSSSVGVSSREMTAVVEAEDEASLTEEPYAKLIYRALMSAPGHSMVLQEIYQWFRENTVKGASDTKGWMNSIRHNLSMNAAFRKTERKMPGDDAKKSTEWVLEPFAIKDGVQSTTRYRKGTGSKKFNRSEAPVPSRQSSGRKGGMAPKLKHQRQSGKGLEIGLRRVDENRREEFHRHSRNEITRRRSPLTPPHPPESAQNMHGVGMKLDGFESSLPCGVNSDAYGAFEDTQGVYLEDNSPLFIGAQEMDYYHGLQGPLHRY